MPPEMTEDAELQELANSIYETLMVLFEGDKRAINAHLQSLDGPQDLVNWLKQIRTKANNTPYSGGMIIMSKGLKTEFRR